MTCKFISLALNEKGPQAKQTLQCQLEFSYQTHLCFKSVFSLYMTRLLSIHSGETCLSTYILAIVVCLNVFKFISFIKRSVHADFVYAIF